jgi:uncharacterized protein
MTTAITSGRHMLLTTFRKDGSGVATPVWPVEMCDGRVGMWTAAGTGKYKRLRHDHHVTVQPCTARGRATAAGPVLGGTAEIVRSGPLFDQARAEIRAKYGRMIPLVRCISRLQGRLKRGQKLGDTVVLISIKRTPEDRR